MQSLTSKIHTIIGNGFVTVQKHRKKINVSNKMGESDTTFKDDFLGVTTTTFN